MKRMIYALGTMVLLSFVLFAIQLFQGVGSVGSAQVSTPVEEGPIKPELIEVSDEDVVKAYAEADKIHQAVRASIKSRNSKFKLNSEFYSHLTNEQIPEYKGKTQTQMNWVNGRTGVRVNIYLSHNKDDSLYSFRRGLESISMGEFFDAPGIGDKAVLVKNVDFNQKVTSTSLHFVKGRAQVSIYVFNWQRSREKNEKELMEIVRLIEPLVVARAGIRDP